MNMMKNVVVILFGLGGLFQVVEGMKRKAEIDASLLRVVEEEIMHGALEEGVIVATPIRVAQPVQWGQPSVMQVPNNNMRFEAYHRPISSAFVVTSAMALPLYAELQKKASYYRDGSMLVTNNAAHTQKAQHARPEPYKNNQLRTCNECRYTVSHAIRMEVHRNIHALMKENPSMKVYYCDTCDYLTLARTVFNDHALVHQNEKQHACPKGCGSQFKLKRSLNRHLKNGSCHRY